MALIRGEINEIMFNLIEECPNCEDEIKWFFFALSEVTSIANEELEGFEFRRLNTDNEKRYYRYALDCEGEIEFYWKDGVVDDVRVICEPMGS